MKRKLSFVLALILLSSIISCGGESGTTSGTDTTTAGTTVEETTADPNPLTVEKSDFGGHTVTYLTLENYTSHFRIDVESENGDTLNDAGYKREQAVSELLNVEFDSYVTNDTTSALNSAVMANTHEFDFFVPHCQSALNGIVTAGLLLNLYELEDVNFEAPWWNQSIQENVVINNKCYIMSGDLFITWQGMLAVLFNKDYLKNYNIDENLYDLVYEGKWTIDKLMSLSKGVYSDLNGNTTADKEDRFGILFNPGASIHMLANFNQSVAEINEDGCPVLAIGNERMTAIIEKLYAMIWSDETWRESATSTTYATGDYRKILTSGRAFFTYFDVGGLYGDLRTFDFDFGILPPPKLDEKQEDYGVFCGAGVFGVPSDAENLERTGKVMEALGYYSYKYMRPAYFDVVLENKALRDEESYKIMELMHESRQFDFGFNYYIADAADVIGRLVIDSKSTDFASYYASIEASVNNQYKAFYDKVTSID